MDYMLLEIKDEAEILGESTLTGFEDCIEVMSYSHGVAQQVLGTTSHTGRTTGRPNFQDMTVSKVLDATTPLLNYNCAKATNLGAVKLHLVRQDAEGEGDYANAFAYMVYEMDQRHHLLGQRRRGRGRPAGGDAHPELRQGDLDVPEAAGAGSRGRGERRENYTGKQAQRNTGWLGTRCPREGLR